MLALRFHTTGGPEVLRAEEIAAPSAGPGELLVRVESAGVNFIDTYHRSGLYPMPLPSTLGIEAAGTILAVGSGVVGFTAGQRIASPKVSGAYAEQALVPANQAVLLPDTVDAATACALMVQGLTAHYLVRSTWELKPGETCLVHAAAGGVGQLLVQLAKRAGARVIATAGNEAKAGLARSAGADDVILYDAEPFAPAVRRLTAGRGVDVVYDSVGAATWQGSLDSLRPRGLLVSYGNASGPVPPTAPLTLAQKGSLYLTRPTLAHYTASAEELRSRANELFELVSKKQLHVSIGARFPLREAAEAHRALEGRRTTGKVVLLP